jgi:hypothetical protein
MPSKVHSEIKSLLALFAITSILVLAHAANAGVSGPTPWAVLRCQLQDRPLPSIASYPNDPEAFYADFFTAAGAGKRGLYDYWSEVSNQKVSLAGTTIFPWEPLHYSIHQILYRTGRQKRFRAHSSLHHDYHVTKRSRERGRYAGTGLCQCLHG